MLHSYTGIQAGRKTRRDIYRTINAILSSVILAAGDVQPDDFNKRYNKRIPQHDGCDQFYADQRATY
jgi:hypothetical protein